jgi:hypothetical protein
MVLGLTGLTGLTEVELDLVYAFSELGLLTVVE